MSIGLAPPTREDSIELNSSRVDCRCNVPQYIKDWSNNDIYPLLKQSKYYHYSKRYEPAKQLFCRFLMNAGINNLKTGRLVSYSQNMNTKGRKTFQGITLGQRVMLEVIKCAIDKKIFQDMPAKQGFSKYESKLHLLIQPPAKPARNRLSNFQPIQPIQPQKISGNLVGLTYPARYVVMKDKDKNVITDNTYLADPVALETTNILSKHEYVNSLFDITYKTNNKKLKKIFGEYLTFNTDNPYSVFNTSFLLGGRIFYHNPHITKQERATTRFDNEDNIEADLISTFPNLLYNVYKKLDYLECNGDCYKIFGETTSAGIRTCSKILFTPMIFSLKGKEQAVRAATRSLSLFTEGGALKDGNNLDRAMGGLEAYFQCRAEIIPELSQIKEYRTKRKLPVYENGQRVRTKSGRGFKTKSINIQYDNGKQLGLAIKIRKFFDKLYDLIVEKHKPIADLFHQPGIGLGLQNLERTLALAVIKDVAEQVQPLVSIHDSWLGRKSFKNGLIAIINNNYYKLTGLSAKLEIKTNGKKCKMPDFM